MRLICVLDQRNWCFVNPVVMQLCKASSKGGRHRLAAQSSLGDNVSLLTITHPEQPVGTARAFSLLLLPSDVARAFGEGLGHQGVLSDLRGTHGHLTELSISDKAINAYVRDVLMQGPMSTL